MRVRTRTSIAAAARSDTADPRTMCVPPSPYSMSPLSSRTRPPMTPTSTPYPALPPLLLLTTPPTSNTNPLPRPQLQDQTLYCGTGCQAGYGKCDNETAPPLPTAPPKTANAGDTCGPIVNARCATGLCCSGSNFCGTGESFCGEANWCQEKWGECE